MNWPTHMTHNGVLRRIQGWCIVYRDAETHERIDGSAPFFDGTKWSEKRRTFETREEAEQVADHAGGSWMAICPVLAPRPAAIWYTVRFKLSNGVMGDYRPGDKRQLMTREGAERVANDGLGKWRPGFGGRVILRIVRRPR